MVWQSRKCSDTDTVTSSIFQCQTGQKLPVDWKSSGEGKTVSHVPVIVLQCRQHYVTNKKSHCWGVANVLYGTNTLDTQSYQTRKSSHLMFILWTDVNMEQNGKNKILRLNASKYSKRSCNPVSENNHNFKTKNVWSEEDADVPRWDLWWRVNARSEGIQKDIYTVYNERVNLAGK